MERTRLGRVEERRGKRMGEKKLREEKSRQMDKEVWGKKTTEIVEGSNH